MKVHAAFALVGVVAVLAPTSPPVIGLDAAGARDSARQPHRVATEPSSERYDELLVLVAERLRPADPKDLPGR